MAVGVGASAGPFFVARSFNRHPGQIGAFGFFGWIIAITLAAMFVVGVVVLAVITAVLLGVAEVISRIIRRPLHGWTKVTDFASGVREGFVEAEGRTP